MRSASGRRLRRRRGSSVLRRRSRRAAGVAALSARPLRTPGAGLIPSDRPWLGRRSPAPSLLDPPDPAVRLVEATSLEDDPDVAEDLPHRVSRRWGRRSAGRRGTTGRHRSSSAAVAAILIGWQTGSPLGPRPGVRSGSLLERVPMPTWGPVSRRLGR